MNAVGDVIGADGRVLAGSTAPAEAVPFPAPAPFEEDAHRANTTLVAVATDAVCNKTECHLLAVSAHDGFARALHPAHTRYDGDLAVAAATCVVDVHLDRLRVAVADGVTVNVEVGVSVVVGVGVSVGTRVAVFDTVAEAVDVGVLVVVNVAVAEFDGVAVGDSDGVAVAVCV